MKDIKTLRKEKGLSQISLAGEVGVSLTSVQLWERGISHPGERNTERLRSVLGEDLELISKKRKSGASAKD